MKVCMTDLIYALSYALDGVEHDLLGVTTHHAGRVAFLCARMGVSLGLDDEQRVDLACAAMLHDNALTEYALVEQGEGLDLFRRPEGVYGLPNMGKHCAMGERNLERMPFHGRVIGAVLYHHENADGSGPFAHVASETPLYAQVIHLADILDLRFDYGREAPSKYAETVAFVDSSRGTLFADEIADAFEGGVGVDAFEMIDRTRPDDLLHLELPDIIRDYSDAELMGITTIFAHIIDCKSTYAQDHCQDVADLVRGVALEHGLSRGLAARVYLAGALHDLGSLVADEEVFDDLEELSDDECVHVHTHPWLTFDILRHVRGFEDIARWASVHHERLDGSGYPFGRTSFELSKVDRLMACADVYEELTENRPARPALSAEEADAELRAMVAAGQLDGDICEDVIEYRQRAQ